MEPERSFSPAAAAHELVTKTPRVPLGHWPTPLEPLARLSIALGGPLISVKRDDTISLGMGGNKVRALEYLMAEALSADADTVLTAGVVQSNSVRQVAAAAAKLGLDCVVAVIRDRVLQVEPGYAQTGNFLLGTLYGATYEDMSWSENVPQRLAAIAERLRRQGLRPYIVPYGCASLTGAIGYVRAAIELAKQFASMTTPVTHVVHACGTGATQAGLVAGFAALDRPVKVIGVDIDADPAGVRRRVGDLLRQLRQVIGIESEVLIAELQIETDYSAGAYGTADQATVAAIRTLARTESLIFDPVYSGKAAAALIELVRQRFFQPEDHVVLLHTGGSPAIYAYQALLRSPEGSTASDDRCASAAWRSRPPYGHS